MRQSETPADADLVLAAQHGDTAAVGLLLARHEPSMRAVALNILGFRPEADDVVQDAALIALRRLGDLRDPTAVGPWLRSIVRNGCRMQLRAATPVPVPDIASVLRPDVEHDPAAVLERNAHRDWVWSAVEELSPPLRLVTILRYFTAVTSYEQLAQVCGIPVGTVRSRLSQARGKLHAALLTTAEQAHDDAAALGRSRRAEAQTILGAAQDGSFGASLAAYWHPGVETTWPHGIRTTGFDYLVRAMDHDLGDGVRQRLTNVVASRDVVIWEADLLSPPDDPFHCPPAVTWVQFLREGRTSHVRLFHPIPRPVAS
ncbi:RNA polymerase sigma factor [Mycobacterium yunnanensis]|uniref:RNA polymerase sigma factor n=1 Tax=Mycobacterium yunnanensis TaxID=368477 RepID=UPI0021F2D5F7|nr:sigma-70 family RNA polymerase sigma factor [Mycobacterium yunnanensis]